MYLRTLGGLKLEGSDLARHKPLLLLAYLALEGRQPRRAVAELFWLGYKNPLSNLSVALSQLRKVDESLIEADDTYVEAHVNCDALALRADGADTEVLDVYRGAFLEGIFLSDWSAELEEWVYEQRESLAAFAQMRFLGVAERLATQGQLQAASRRAEEAYRLSGAPPLAPEALPRFYRLFALTQHPYAYKVQSEAQELGLELGIETGAAQPLPSPVATLPRPATSLVGRERELAELTELFRGDARIVTLTGLNGCGKTRLALELAHLLEGAFKDGVYFIPLSGVTDFEEARRRGARVLGIPPGELELFPNRIRTFVADKEILFVLDGVDMAIQTAPTLTELLWVCPNVKLLVTSEERLRVAGEQLYPLQGLSFTVEDESAARHEAAALFAARARRVKPGFTLNADTLPAISRICELVEGLPLAVELAAPWVKLLPVETIADEIATNLDFLRQDTRSPLREFSSINAAFEQSWQRLEKAEREALKTLSLFQASFRLEAARTIAGVSLDDLLALHDKSLLEVLPGRRFYLNALLRRFLRAKLAETDPPAETNQDALERSFVTHYASILADAEDKITDPGRMSATLSELERDLPNVEQAWRWALEKEMTEFFRVAGTVVSFLDFTGRWQQGIELFERAVNWLEPQDDTEKNTKNDTGNDRIELWGELVRDLVELLYRGGRHETLAYIQSVLPKVQKRDLRSLEAYLTLGIGRIHTVLGDIEAARAALQRARELEPDETLRTDMSLADLELLYGDDPPPKLFGSETAATLGQEHLELAELFYEGRYALRNADFADAKALLESCMALAEKLNFLSFSPFYHDTLALILHVQEDYAAAEATAREGYRFAEKEAAVGMMFGLEATLARILPHVGKLEEAKEMAQKSLHISRDRGIKPVLLKNVVSVAEQYLVTEKFAEAAQAFNLALAHPATMRIEHPLIKKRLDELATHKPEKLESVTLEDFVAGVLEG